MAAYYIDDDVIETQVNGWIFKISVANIPQDRREWFMEVWHSQLERAYKRGSNDAKNEVQDKITDFQTFLDKRHDVI